MSQGSGKATHVQIEGLDEVLKSFNGLQKDLRKEANRELREAASQIATAHLMPALPGWAAAASTAPLATKVVQTARVRRDRKVAVRIGSVLPPLDSFSKGRRMKRKKENAAAVAWGSESGPDGGHLPGSASGGEGRNFYRVPRNLSGFWIGRNLGRISPKAVDAYTTALISIARKYGLL